MASRYLIAGHNGDISSTANWSATRGGAGGSSVPGASDVAYIYDGYKDINAGLSNFLAATVIIGGDFQGNIGTAAAALELGTASAVCIIEKMPKDYVNIAAKASTTIATVSIRSLARGTVNLSGTGTITNVYAGMGGTLNIDPGLTVTNLRSAGTSVQAPQSSNTITLLALKGYTPNPHVIRRPVTTLYLADSSLYLRGDNTVGTGYVDKGGFYVHDSTGTITTLEVTAGGEAKAGNVRFALTNAISWANGRLFQGSDKVTITNSTSVGGDFSTSGGTE